MWVVKEQKWKECFTFPLFLGILTCSDCCRKMKSVSDLEEEVVELAGCGGASPAASAY